jgi:hypothetical protein
VATVVGIPIAALPAATALTGDELVPVAQGVAGAVKQTTSGAFVTLASGVIVPAATAAAIAAIVPVTNANLADMAQATVKGRAAGAGTGKPQDLTQAQLTALITAFTSILGGGVPASGGGTTNFLRADGTWAPAGGSASFPLLAPDGDPTAPSYSFANLPNAGMLLAFGSALGFSFNDLLRLVVSDSIDMSNDLENDVIPAFSVANDGTENVVATQGAKFYARSSNVTASGRAGFNLGVGTAPTVFEDGDLWNTVAAVFARINGVSKQLADIVTGSFTCRITKSGGAPFLDVTINYTVIAGTWVSLQYRQTSSATISVSPLDEILLKNIPAVCLPAANTGNVVNQIVPIVTGGTQAIGSATTDRANTQIILRRALPDTGSGYNTFEGMTGSDCGITAGWRFNYTIP